MGNVPLSYSLIRPILTGTAIFFFFFVTRMRAVALTCGRNQTHILSEKQGWGRQQSDHQIVSGVCLSVCLSIFC